MNLRVLMVAIVLAVLFLITGILYAANGDLIVNGSLGVGTTTPQGKAEVNGNMIVDGDTTMKGNTTTNGNTVVNGNLGVGTTTPSEKAEVNGNLKVNGNLCVGGNCTNSLHVSGGVYGYCTVVGIYPGCTSALSPAACVPNPQSGGKDCICPNGYTKVILSSSSLGMLYNCYKN